MNRLRVLLVAGASSLLVPLVATSSPASADAPTKYGWWNEANLGLGVSPAPASVPSGGLYVENGFAGPVAISAMTFAVAPGAAVGKITLVIAGSPTITSPPVACPLSAASEGYSSAEGGPWSDRPSYSCQQAQVTGAVAKDGKTVSFDAGPLLRDGQVAAAILAGGSADKIAFAKPGPSALAVTTAGIAAPSTGPVGGIPASTTAAAPAATPASPSSPAVSAGAATGPAGAASPGVAGATAAPNLPSGNVVPAASQPAIAPVSQAVPAAQTQQAPVSTVRHHGGGGGSRTVGEVIGLIGLIGVLTAYTEGYGLLGGRTRRKFPVQPVAAGPARLEA
ncbi:MAG TPA: hypothetical protein VFH70_07580 [Acidimicrobiales bacterium]|nr:hypothetical protein [Acidimicrobiales bacterium]